MDKAEPLDPLAVAHGLLAAAEVCSPMQDALRARLTQGARVILQQQQDLIEARRGPVDESIPVFLRRQAD